MGESNNMILPGVGNLKESGGVERLILPVDNISPSNRSADRFGDAHHGPFKRKGEITYIKV